MFNIRTAAILIAVAASSSALAQTPADLQRLTGAKLSVSASPTAPIAQSFSAQDVARLISAPAGHSSAPLFQVSNAFGPQDLARQMGVDGAGRVVVRETFTTAAR